MARAIWVFLLVSAAAALPWQSIPSVFRSGVDAVRVDVLVTHGGRPIANLTTKDFEVFDNGVSQHVSLVDVGAVPIILMLDVDVSESVAGERLTSLVAACHAAIGALRSIDRASVVSFSHEITERVPVTGNRDQLGAGFSALAGAGNTSLYDAVYAGLLLGGAGESRTLLLVFSDGWDTSSWLSPSVVLDAAKRSPVVVYGVTTQLSAESEVQRLMRDQFSKPPSDRLAHPTARDFLEQIATVTGGRLLRTEQPDLGKRFFEIVEEFQNRYVLSYTPTGASGRGWHDISVHVLHKDVDIQSRRGYWS